MLDEPQIGNSVGDALGYLLANKKILVEKQVDGISKLELLYLFLREYKELKLLTEEELQT